MVWRGGAGSEGVVRRPMRGMEGCEQVGMAVVGAGGAVGTMRNGWV